MNGQHYCHSLNRFLSLLSRVNLLYLAWIEFCIDKNFHELLVFLFLFQISKKLVHEHRSIFEQELDKQVKVTFLQTVNL